MHTPFFIGYYSYSKAICFQILKTGSKIVSEKKLFYKEKEIQKTVKLLEYK